MCCVFCFICLPLVFCVPNVASFSGFILTVPSVSSNVYLPMIKLHIIYDFHELLINWINLHLHKTNVILNTFTYKIESVKKTSGHAYNTYIYCIHLSHNITIYHIFRLKYRCFVHALSMIVPSLYRLYPISHTLYRIPYIVYPKNFKIFKFSKYS